MKRVYFFIGSVPEKPSLGKPGLPREGLGGLHAVDVGRLAEIVVGLQQHVGAVRQEAEPARRSAMCSQLVLTTRSASQARIVDRIHVGRRRPEAVAGLLVERPRNRGHRRIDVDALD